jgi:hypothetical protein
VFGGAVSFLCHGFCSHTLALLYFLQMKSVINKMYLQKNKQVQPTLSTKTHAIKKLPEAK